MPEQTATPAPPRRRYRTVLRAVAFGLGIPVGLVAVALGMVLVAGNTGIGQREIERRLPGLTGGSVHLSGLGGRFPDALHVRHLELDDYRGAWLSIDDLQLDWSPLRLLTRQAVISNLSMARLSIPRLSEDDPAHPPKPEKESGESIHMGVSIHAVNVARIEVGAPIARIPAAFSLNGHASLADIAPVLDHFSVATLPPADIALKLTRLDHPGSLDLDTRLDRRTVSLNLHAHEDAQGFLSTLTQLPALAPLDLTLGLHGPRDQAELALALTTGAVKAGANGQVGLIDRHMALDVTASSKDLVAGSGLSWQGASLKAHLGGTLNRPKGNGVFDIDRLTTDTAGFTSLHMVADGLSGQENGQPEHAAIHATLTGLRIPGSQPTLFAGEPVRLDLMWHPDATGGPVDLTLSHPLVQLAGQIMTAGEMAATFHADLPDLAPLAAAGGTKLHGHAGLSGNVTLPGKGHDGRFGLDSKVVLDGGLPIAVGLIGDKGQLNAAGTISRDRHGANTITFTSLAVQGSTLQLDAPQLRLVTGTPLRVDADAHLGLSDLHVLAPTLHGKMQADLHAAGPVDDLMASVKTQASIAAGNTVAGDMQASASMAHLPQVKQGALDISGTLDRAPIAVSARLDSNADDSRHMQVEHLGWKSLTGQADMTLPAGHVVPSGTLDLHMTRLADLHELTGQDINGHLSATVRTTAATATAPAELDVNVDSALGAAMARVDRLVLRGRVLDPVGTPTTDLDLVVDNAHFRDMGGHGHVTAKGPISGLNITAQSGVDTPWTGAATLDTALLANVPGHSVTVHRLAAEARHEQVRLDAPVSVTYGKETAIDHLRATITPPHGQAGNVEASGRIAPTLDLHASITRLSPDLLTPFIANLQAQGMLSADARLTGTTTNPSGKVSVHGTDLKYHTDYTSSLAPASLDATANLNAGMAQVDARLQAGTQVNLSLRGTAPVNRTGQLNLQADGNLDLAVANAYLGAQGMQAGGNLQMGIGMRGTLGQPRMSGTLTLANGLFHDFGQGIQLSAMRGTVNAMGDRLVISSLTAQAGKGTLAASGSYGVLQPGQPIDLHIHADNARPLASDLITATLDGDLGVKGLLSSRIDATGDITLKQVDINIPDSLPTSVAHLNVIRPEDEKNAQTVVHTSPLVVGLGLDVRSPGRFYVRGHGLNTEMHGRIHTGGTATAPVVTGAFSLVKGGFSLGGISLDFSKGQVGFNGVGVTHAIDPTLDFVAERSTNDGTARLNVGGYASAPKITFSSSPPLSQDQILAILLFGTDSQSLSATQMASIAAAVATLSGGSAFDPLGMVRKTLHLDRLQMSSSSNGSGGNDTGAIEAGKYVMRGVYVGAKQATSGSGTQAQVQVDLTKRLKINTTVGTGGNVTGFTTPENDPGSSIGLLYQFKY